MDLEGAIKRNRLQWCVRIGLILYLCLRLAARLEVWLLFFKAGTIQEMYAPQHS